MNKRKAFLIVLGVFCVLISVSTWYGVGFLNAFYLDEWWSGATFGLLVTLMVGSIFGGVACFISAFEGD